MISIREIDYDTDKTMAQLFLRLATTVERISWLPRELFADNMITDRSWVGVYDEVKMTFGLVEPQGFLSRKIFRIIVRGRLSSIQGKTIVNVKLGISWLTVLWFSVLYCITAVIIVEIALSQDARGIGPFVIWTLLFPFLHTVLLIRKLNKIEKKIEATFGLW